MPYKQVISFFAAGVPKPGGSKTAFMNPKTHKVIVMDSCKKNKEWRQCVAVFAREAYQGEPIEGPVNLDVIFLMPRPKTHLNSKGILKKSAPYEHTKKPDLTKLLRSTEDALVQDAHILKDDSQIVDQHVTKGYCQGSQPPGAHIRIEVLDEIC
jgi:Holliday junction resolvase RusA-like endonuclease